MSSPDTESIPLRADARRNREKLLSAATELFSSTAIEDVTLEAIARQAGVGIGTLYRHFPSREALVEAAYRSEVDQLAGAADELLSAGRPADTALAEWMHRFVGYATAKRGMSSAMQTSAGYAQIASETGPKLAAAVTTLLDAGAADGTLRTDVDAADVLVAMNGVWRAIEEDDAARAARLIGLLMDGLRAGARR
jgi:AcrR family transcriptional regulator